MLDIPACSREAEKLSVILRALYGPTGTSVATQNSIGGSSMICRDIGAVLVNYEAVQPTTKLMIAAIMQHDANVSDGRCLLGIILTCIVKKCWLSEFHPRLCCNVLSWCLHLTSNHLPQIVECRFGITTKDIIEQLRSSISCKLSWSLSRQEVDRLVHTAAEVFIKSGGEMNTRVLTFFHSKSISFNCELHEGVLLDGYHSPAILTVGEYKALLVESSLSGDIDELEELTYSGSTTSDLSQAVMYRLTGLVEQLIKRDVKLLLCQRVIHPTIKKRLHGSNIQYLERLGSTLMSKLASHTGTTAFTSITESAPVLEPVSLACRHVTVKKETWILLTSTHNSTCTTHSIVIAHWSEHIAKIIEKSFTQSLYTLNGLLSDGRLLPGRGRWQATLAAVLDEKSKLVKKNEAQRLGTTPPAFREVVGFLISVLQSLAKDSDSAPPQTIYDSYMTQSAAVTTALTVARSVLMIGTTLDAG